MPHKIGFVDNGSAVLAQCIDLHKHSNDPAKFRQILGVN